ncbi:MAG: hypothetical protein KAG84_07660 [Bacteroidales bacterium]|nr:hypothetical protein [Bacteroidales bacterium]
MYSEKEAMQSRGCCFVPSVDQNENINQHSCCKLDAYDWISDVNFIEEKRYFDIVEVRFKNNRKGFFRSPEGEMLRRGDIVAVETSPGHDIGIVSLTGEIVRLQMHKKKVPYKDTYIEKVYRKARSNDIEKWIEAAALEIPSMITTRKAVMSLGLDMKINDVEYQGDKTKAIFYYTAENRVDFRELIKILAEKFSVRIEMKQIGVRQESSRLGGIGSCGRELCCSSWLTDFNSVSTNTARLQNLSMNPQKLAGQCGKLKCCLNFEQDNYKEESAKFPPSDVKLKTKSGDAFFQKKDILSGIMWYSYFDKPSVFIGIRRQDVQNIQRMNEKGKLPEALNDHLNIEIEEAVKFDNVIGQDDVTRFDKVKTKGNKGKGKRTGNKGNSNNNRNKNNKNANTAKVSEGANAKKKANTKSNTNSNKRVFKKSEKPNNKRKNQNKPETKEEGN